MRKILATVLLLGAVAFGQSGHSVQVSWGASPDAAANPTLTYNLYRAVSVCTGSPTFTKINTTPITGLTFTDTNVSVGNTYCYNVTAALNGLESIPSPSTPAVILPAPPGTPSTTAK